MLKTVIHLHEIYVYFNIKTFFFKCSLFKTLSLKLSILYDILLK